MKSNPPTSLSKGKRLTPKSPKTTKHATEYEHTNRSYGDIGETKEALGWIKEFEKNDGIGVRIFIDLMIANKGDRKFVNKKMDELEDFISNLLSHQRQEIKKRIGKQLKHNIGMLRQWLNEDRITDKPMVTNEDLELWLLSDILNSLSTKTKEVL